RYLMPTMTWMWALAGMGIVEVLRWAAQRWPAASWRPAACSALVLAVTFLPGVSFLLPHRANLRHLAVAAAWIREHGGGDRPMSTSTSQVNYFAGCLELPLPPTDDFLLGEIRQGVRFVLYTEGDVKYSPELISMLRSSPRLEAPVTLPLP